MQKAIVVFFMLSFSLLYIHADDFSVVGHPYDPSLKVVGDKAFFTAGIDESFVETESAYSYEVRDGLKYIHLLEPTNKTFLLLESKEFSVLINDRNFKETFGINTIYKSPKIRTWGIFEGCLIYQPRIIDASSFLTEGEIEYRPENLRSQSGGNPWVEGAAGNGIGQTITFEKNVGHVDIHSLIISIGYVDFNKPYLYSYNSRPKEIRLWFDEKTKFYDIELADTPNPQIIHLPPFEEERITLEIIDVYPGTKWEDTCINFLLTVAEMKEYFNFN